MSWVRSGWHEEEVNGSKAVVDCLSLLWLHDHDGLLSDICSAILSLGFHCTNRHQMFTFNKNVFVVELFLLCNNLIHTHHAVTLQDVVVVVRYLLCTWLLHMFSGHLQSVGVLEFFLICNMCFISLSFAFKWFLLQPALPTLPTSCSCLDTFVCRIESPLYLKSFISLAKPLDQFLQQMLMLQWSQPIFLFRPWWGFSWNPNWVLFLHSHLLSFDNGVIISGTQQSTNQRLWSTGFTTAKMLTLWIGSSFWTLTKSYDTLLLPGRLELKKADLWQLNMGE